MKLENDRIYLETTGRVCHDANCEFVGINPALHVSGGYDSGVGGANHDYEPWDEDDCKKFTVEERHELADYMIKLWTEYKNKIV